MLFHAFRFFLALFLLTIVGLCALAQDWNIELLDQLTYIGTGASTIKMYENYIFVTHNDDSLEAFDIANPINPIRLGGIAIPSVVWDIAFQNDTAYCANGESGLMVLDISNPANVEIIGSMDTPGYADGITISGDLVYLADHYSLRIVDVTNPANLVQVGICSGYVNLNHIEKIGNYCYVTGGGTYFRVFNVSRPTAPFQTGVYAYNYQIQGLDADSEYLYAPYSGALHIMDVSNPHNPFPLSICPWSASYGVEVSGDIAVTNIGPQGGYIIDVGDPANPALYSIANPPGVTNNLDCTDNLLCFASGGIYLYDISAPAYPKEIGDVIWYKVLDVELVRDYAFIAAGTDGLRVIDISNPSNLIEIVQLPLPGCAEAIFIDGFYAYIANDVLGLKVVNISNPTNPVLVTSLALPGDADEVIVQGNYAYVCASSAGLRIIDISNPAVPQEVGFFIPQFYDVSEVIINGNYVYLATGNKEILTLNISNPANPQQVTFTMIPHEVRDLAIKGDYLYAIGGCQFSALSINFPNSPCLCETFTAFGDGQDIVFEHNYAFMAYLNGGLYLYDLSQPLNPIEIDNYSCNAFSVAVSRNQIFVAGWNTLYSLICTPAFDLEEYSGEVSSTVSRFFINPNPFNPESKLSFELPFDAEVSLVIYDIQGREIASMVNGQLSMGKHQFVWNAEAYPSGIYFAKLTVDGDQSSVQKLLLVK